MSHFWRSLSGYLPGFASNGKVDVQKRPAQLVRLNIVPDVIEACVSHTLTFPPPASFGFSCYMSHTLAFKSSHLLKFFFSSDLSWLLCWSENMTPHGAAIAFNRLVLPAFPRAKTECRKPLRTFVLSCLILAATCPHILMNKLHFILANAALQHNNALDNSCVDNLTPFLRIYWNSPYNRDRTELSHSIINVHFQDSFTKVMEINYTCQQCGQIISIQYAYSPVCQMTQHCRQTGKTVQWKWCSNLFEVLLLPWTWVKVQFISVQCLKLTIWLAGYDCEVWVWLQFTDNNLIWISHKIFMQEWMGYYDFSTGY